MSLFNYFRKSSANSCKDEGTLIETVKTTYSENYQSNFITWLETPEHRAMVRLVHDNCHTGNKDAAFMALKAPKVAGVTYVFDPERWAEEEFFFLFDFLSQQLHKQQYLSQKTMTETWRHARGTEVIQSCKFSNKEHYYDNVLLRVVSRNDKVHSLKFCACQSIQNEIEKPEQTFQSLVQELTS